MLTAIIVAFLLILIYLYLIAPDIAPANRMKEFLGVNYAHRGLYSPVDEVPENSMAAFSRAVAAGYGIELDVRLTADDEIVVFHDESLKRQCGIDKRMDKLTYDEVSKLRLNGTKEGIPRFAQVLELTKGRVPMLIELKRVKKGRLLCEKTADMLSNYNGAFCVQSFDPSVVGWFRKKHPEIFRGQLVSSRKDFRKSVNPISAFAGGNVLLNCYSRPNFIAHSKYSKSISVKICEFLGAKKFVWTVNKDDDYKKYAAKNDSVIFEQCIPKK